MTELREIRQRTPLTLEEPSEESSAASSVESRELEILASGAIAGDERRHRTKKEGR